MHTVRDVLVMITPSAVLTTRFGPSLLYSIARPVQLGDYGALIRRQWWLVALATTIGILADFFYYSSKT